MTSPAPANRAVPVCAEKQGLMALLLLYEFIPLQGDGIVLPDYAGNADLSGLPDLIENVAFIPQLQKLFQKQQIFRDIQIQIFHAKDEEGGGSVDEQN